jgi:hypothetical protein
VGQHRAGERGDGDGDQGVVGDLDHQREGEGGTQDAHQHRVADPPGTGVGDVEEEVNGDQHQRGEDGHDEGEADDLGRAQVVDDEELRVPPEQVEHGLSHGEAPQGHQHEGVVAGDGPGRPPPPGRGRAPSGVRGGHSACDSRGGGRHARRRPSRPGRSRYGGGVHAQVATGPRGEVR